MDGDPFQVIQVEYEILHSYLPSQPMIRQGGKSLDGFDLHVAERGDTGKCGILEKFHRDW